MIQDILPHVFRNEFNLSSHSAESYLLYYKNDKVLLRDIEGQLIFPQFKDLIENFSGETVYLFKVNEQEFYLLEGDYEPSDFGADYGFYELNVFRSLHPMWCAFAAVTGSQLYRFYRNNKYCGFCGTKMNKKQDERAMICPNCALVEYPKISPAVIVAITNGDKLLMTKYAQREYKKYALVAGFVEFGETLEQTVQREVFEEVGLRVKNIKYYDNQPWGLSDSVLVGFFAELDGSDEIKIDSSELEIAQWVERKDIQSENLGMSLTQKMIDAFKNRELITK